MSQRFAPVRRRHCAVGVVALLVLSACSVGNLGAGNTTPTPILETPAPVLTPTPSPSPSTLEWPEVFELANSGVTRIAVTTCEGGGSGSGFLVGPDTVMTAAHVVDGATSVSLRFGAAVFAGEPILVDEENDLALVNVEGEPVGHAFAIANEPARVGSEVAALGFPNGRPLAMTRGAVTSVDLRVSVEGQDLRDLFRTDSAIIPGNSGGPVVDSAGDVVGVVTAGSSQAGEAGAISRPSIMAALESWRSGDASTVMVEPCETSGEEPYGGTPVSVSVTSMSPEAASIAQTFQLYGQAINDRYPDLVWDLLTPTMHDQVGGDIDTYFAGLATSSWISVDVLNVQTVDSVTDRATIALRTEQAAEFGPDGSTCTDWVITYTLVLDQGYWQIDGAARDEEPVSCTP